MKGQGSLEYLLILAAPMDQRGVSLDIIECSSPTYSA